MATAITYKGSYAGIGEMMRSPFMLAHLRLRASLVKDAAEALAPVGSAKDGDTSPGTFKSSFVIRERAQAAKLGPGHRIVFDIVSTDPLGYVKEMGSTRVHRPRAGVTPQDEFEASLLTLSADNIGVTHVGGSHTLRRALDMARF